MEVGRRVDAEHVLIGRVYDAALDPSRWQALLADIAECLGAAGVIAGEFDLRDPASSRVWRHNVDDELFSVCRQRGRALLARVVADSAPAASGMQPEDLQDAVVPFRHRDASLNLAGALLPSGQPGCCTVLTMHRCPTREPFCEASGEVLSRLVTHLARALRVLRQIATGKHDSDRLLDLLGSLRSGIILLDAAGLVAWRNDAADRILRQHPGLRLPATRNLVAVDPAQNRALQVLVRGALSMTVGAVDDGATPVAGSVGIHHPAATHPLLVNVVPLGHVVPMFVPSGSRVCGAAVISNPDEGRSVSGAYLEEAYGLTRAESAIANALLNGESIADIARQRNVSQETVRAQVKSVFAKTGTAGQPGLVRLLMLLAGSPRGIS